jgi:Secretion system C-terminal sorting domain
MMKKYILALFMLLGTLQGFSQYFEATLTNSGSTLIFGVRPKPGGGNIVVSTGLEFTNLEFCVRYPMGSPAFTWGTPITGADFVGATFSYKGDNEFGSYPGFTLARFQWLTNGTAFAPNTGLPKTYLEGTTYEVFRVAANGTSGTVNFDLIHNDGFTPSYIAITNRTGAAMDATASPGAPAFFGPGFSIVSGDHILPVNNVPVPVKFNGFTAVKRDNDGLLTWAVENESPITDRYEIERSFNGLDFSKFATVNPKNNGLTANTYNLTDANLSNLRTSSGVIYYRIKQIDKDGQFVYSEIKSIRLDSKGFAVGVYPNPVKDVAVLSIDLMDNEAISLLIIDAAGKQVQQMQIQGVRGLNVKRVSMGAFASGTYQFKVRTATEVKTISVVKE